MSEPTVHIIDDDPSARSGLTRLVRATGMNVESFASAADFLASGKRDGPGCIVLDVRMPDMTGPELQEELSKSDYCMPIIFLSAHGDVPTTARTMKKGAVDFLTKPVDRADLQRALRASLALDAENRAQLARQIAGELGIAEDTVKIHRRRVMQKLGIDSVADLVRLCEKAGVAPAQASGK
jgi:FixJ family two-component response regulator